MTSKIEEINTFMLIELKKLGVEDTSENRIAFLTGLQDAWNEDSDDSLEKSMYQMALSMEISKLKTLQDLQW